MTRLTRLFSIILVLCLLAACASKGLEQAKGIPADFSKMSDEQRMEYMMRHAEPDSVARFLCKAALGKYKGVKIDTLGIAYLYVLEKYTGQDADKFSIEFERVKSELSLGDKMNLDFTLGLADTLQVGYALGLGYVAQIREKHLSAKDVEKELKEFRKVCGADTATYNRFLRGFQLGLSEDRGKDLSEEIYRKFMTYKQIPGPKADEEAEADAK